MESSSLCCWLWLGSRRKTKWVRNMSTPMEEPHDKDLPKKGPYSRRTSDILHDNNWSYKTLQYMLQVVPQNLLCSPPHRERRCNFTRLKIRRSIKNEGSSLCAFLSLVSVCHFSVCIREQRLKICEEVTWFRRFYSLLFFCELIEDSHSLTSLEHWYIVWILFH